MVSIGARRGVLAAVVLLAVVASFVPSVLTVRDYPLDAPGLVLQVVLVVAAILLLQVPELRQDGWWLLGAAIALGVSFFSSSTFESGYWTQVGWTFQSAAAACLVGPFLRLPDQPASPRTVRWLSVGAWIAVVGLSAVSGLFWDPAVMTGYSGPGRWFTLSPWESGAKGLAGAVPVVLVPVLVGFTVAQVRRYRRAGGPNRKSVRVLVWLTVLMAWGLLARIGVDAYGAPWEIVRVVVFGYNALVAAAIVVVLLVAIAANLRRAGFLDALLAAGGHAPAIEAVLARYVDDPTLRLRFRTDEGWTDAAGHPVAEASPAAGRVFHPIVIEPEGPAVVTDLDAAVDPESKTVGPLLDAAGVVLARARLSVQQAAQAVQLRASRARIIEAGVQERRRLERDLHDGAQQHLLAAQAALARAELGGEPDDVTAAIEFAQSRLTSTMAELRALARGQHPALLSQAGLAVALGSLVQLSDRVEVQVAPHLEGRRFAPVVEATAWFVASEGVVNALKYTDAGVTVLADVDDDALRVRVVDAGDGGADFTPGGGLTGLRDRVRGTGGTLHLDSHQDSGTTLIAILPARPPEEEP